jgi:hypothetical protein
MESNGWQSPSTRSWIFVSVVTEFRHQLTRALICLKLFGWKVSINLCGFQECITVYLLRIHLWEAATLIIDEGHCSCRHNPSPYMVQNQSHHCFQWKISNFVETYTTQVSAIPSNNLCVKSLVTCNTPLVNLCFILVSTRISSIWPL